MKTVVRRMLAIIGFTAGAVIGVVGGTILAAAAAMRLIGEVLRTVVSQFAWFGDTPYPVHPNLLPALLLIVAGVGLALAGWLCLVMALRTLWPDRFPRKGAAASVGSLNPAGPDA